MRWSISLHHVKQGFPDMDTSPLVLYVNPAWRRGGLYSTLMYPFWGNPMVKESIFAKQFHDTYSFDTRYYGITDNIIFADMVFVPYAHNWLLQYDNDLFDECVRMARESKLPLLVDGIADVEYPIDIENSYVLRYGGYRFLSEPGRIQIPPLADDFLERYKSGKLEIRKKGEGRPSVGFAGWAVLSPMQYFRTIIKEIPIRLRSVIDSRYRACIKGVLWRQQAINVLKKSSRVEFNLLARNSFSGSQRTAQGDMRTLREEMVDTILQNDYTLDVRGDANDSTRLFEVLSLGRIPVIVDTERNFPLKDKVDYSSFALVVDFRDIDRLPERIAEFHKNISPGRFEEMQRNARDAYVHFFRIDVLTRSLVEELKSKLALPKSTPPSPI